MARHHAALVRCGDALRVWFLNTARMYRTERNDGDKWPAERTHAVDQLLVAAVTMPLLECKLFVCSLLVRVASLRQCVCVVLPSFVVMLTASPHVTARHRAPLLRFRDSLRVWLLNTARMHGTERNDGDKWPAERTNAVDQRLVAAVTMSLRDCKLLFCSLLVCVVSLCQCFVCCVLPSSWYCFTARRGTPQHGAAAEQWRGVCVAFECGTNACHATMAVNGLRNERM